MKNILYDQLCLKMIRWFFIRITWTVFMFFCFFWARLYLIVIVKNYSNNYLDKMLPNSGVSVPLGRLACVLPSSAVAVATFTCSDVHWGSGGASIITHARARESYRGLFAPGHSSSISISTKRPAANTVSTP